ncbi:MAG: hypothetical protein ACP5UV_03760, partial [Thermoplasmata archaeon]
MMVKLDKNMYVQKTYKIEDGEAISSANRFIHDYYGQFLYTKKLDSNTFSLNATLPYEVIDNDYKMLRFDDYQDIAEIKYELNDASIKFSGLNRDYIKKTIELQKNNKILRSEKLLFEISQNKFSQLPVVQVFYIPIREIIMKIHDSGSIIMHDNKIDNKLIKYVKLLEQLDILSIRHENETVKLVAGETFKLIERRSKNPVADSFDYVLKKGYEYLYTTIGIRSLSPYMKVSNSLYYNISN